MANAKKDPSADAVSKSAGSHAAELNNAAILTKLQAAALMQCTPRFLERKIRSGELRVCKVSAKMVRILRKDLDAFLSRYASIAA
jgi:excisionase family DNA binding protein